MTVNADMPKKTAARGFYFVIMVATTLPAR